MQSDELQQRKVMKNEMLEAINSNNIDKFYGIKDRAIDHYTGLMIAIYLDAPEMVKLFIEKGANVNIINHLQFTPLIFAVYFDNIVITKILLDNGANVNHQTSYGISALFYTKI